MAMAHTDRRKPFANWVKKLNQKMKRTKGPNNPYPQSGHVSSKHQEQQQQQQQQQQRESASLSQSQSRSQSQPQPQSQPQSQSQSRPQSQSQSIDYPQSTVESGDPRLVVHSAEELGGQSAASTASDGASVEAEGRPPTTAPSYGGTSLAGTMITATDPRRPDSTFSSPAPSARSVATTLSTIQSQMANGVLAGAANNHNNINNNNNNNTNMNNHNNNNNNHHHHHHANQASSSRPGHDSVQYTQPQALVTAMPAGTSDRNTRNAYRPATYSAIIANNLLNDNISILTLASSTQRRRRRSWDTDYDHASVRALPPSQFGGSRESLPLSVLSANLDGQQPTSPGLTTARSLAERSVSGLAVGGHGRADSLNGSVATMPVTSES